MSDLKSTSPPQAVERSIRGTVLADAAIAVLAESGARGLTHRAVDSKAELPQGSASNLFRTRSALVAAALDRHVERELELIESVRGLDGSMEIDIRALAELISQFIEGLSSPAFSDLVVARYELFLEVRRQPKLTERLSAARSGYHQLIGERLSEVGVAPSARNSVAVVSLLDGLSIDRLFHEQTALSNEDRVQVIEAFLRALK
ncbi:MAG: TetR/AcrR family transcriptional regulator [Solirubrobacterales bacterium]|nr:TetR/AcrR family transcriptional regulator [Solirubrobacterales bacterium]